MKSLNQVQLIGNIGSNPEVKKVNENSFVKFSIACNESYKDKEGKKIDKTEWINCVVFGKFSETIEKYVKSGDKVFVSGKLSTTVTEGDVRNNNQKIYYTKVIVNEIIFLSTLNTIHNRDMSDIDDVPF